ncbi:juvenile hormone acid O-methyltransferase, partial [Nephila pilipes]
GVDFWIPESYRDNYDESNYKKMLDEIGFKIILCKVETKEDIFPSDQAFKDMFYSVCPLVKHLPENLKEDFKNDLFENILKHYGRSKDGLPIHRRRTVEIFVRKEN